MKKIKLATAVAALSFSANAAAMPPQVPDTYYEMMWGWVYGVLSARRPCVGPENAWC